MCTEKELNELAFEFFKTFSRFECALKVSGYHWGIDRKAKANWDTYALTVLNIIDNPDTEELREAITYLQNNPPKIQYINSLGASEWKPNNQTGENKAILIFMYIRQVRNNLFHGGKFSNQSLDSNRSKALMENSLLILKACLDISPDVKQAFNEAKLS